MDYDNDSKTENTRVSYPIDHIENIVKPVLRGGHATYVIFLTADAFVVLPPVASLSIEQTQYYFLSSFTAKLAGTEQGVVAPVPNFSACFGAAFLSLHSDAYAAFHRLRRLLAKRMNTSGACAFLVHFGWNGSSKRIAFKDIRAMINAILCGSIDNAPTATMPIFNLTIPTALPPGVDDAILDQRATYDNAGEWRDKAEDLVQRFMDNCSKCTDIPGRGNTGERG